MAKFDTRVSIVGISDITSEADQYDNGQFTLISQEALGNPGADPKNGTCVMFGDQFGISYSPNYFISVGETTSDGAGGLMRIVAGLVSTMQPSYKEMTFTIRAVARPDNNWQFI
jgi:hypothetical protein